MNDTHLPERPSWRCKVDGDPWPCEAARTALLEEYKGFRTALLLYLGAQMAVAREDLAELDHVAAPDDLTDRFIGWARTAAE
ncbi:flavin reductase [Micromonospora sp. NPDC048930]|uniref:flavin reductase n=1 Tax=Micromonospora sp. NPDC048930 TaxID=3364261 RepID=UPI0037220317